MITVTQNLYDTAKRYMAPQSGDPTTQAKKIEKSCKRLIHDIGALQRQYQSMQLFQSTINQCYRQLIEIADTFYREAAPDEVAGYVYTALETFMLVFNMDLLPDHPLSLYEQDRLRDLTYSTYESLYTKLELKNIPTTYLDEVSYALDTLFHPGKLPALAYQHRAYLPRLMRALEALATDQRDKNWLFRFYKVLITHNFNYVGLYNRWQEELANKLKAADSNTARYHLLTKIDRQLRGDYHLPNAAYDIHRESLLDRIRTHIQLEIKILEPLYQSEQSKDLGVILCTLGAAELSVTFHYAYMEDMFDYRTKKEAAEVFSLYIKSKTGRNVTPKTLLKIDKDEFIAAAATMHRKFQNIAAAIKKDYGL